MSTLQSLSTGMKRLMAGPPPMTMEAAKKALMEEITATVRPDSKDLPKAQRDFCNYQKARKCMGKNFQSKIKSEEEMQRRQAYSDRCLNALMKYAVRGVEQQLEWDKATERLDLGKNPDGSKIKIKVSPLRWMSRLIKLDGSPASAAFNEKVVAMAALGQGDITELQFYQCRRKAYAKDKTLSDEQLNKLAYNDLQKGVEGLLDILDEMVAEGKRKAPAIKNAAKQILSGNLTDKELEVAFNVIEDDSSYLMYNAQNTMNDLGENFKVTVSEEKIANRRKEWENDSGVPLAYTSMAEQVANPCYAILDPLELYENQVFGLMNPSGNVTQDDMITLFSVANTTGIQSVIECELDKQLEKYGLSKGDNDVNMMTSDYTLYKNGEKTMIVAVVPPCQENDFDASVRLDVPGRIMKNFAAEIEAKQGKCVAVNTGRTSDQFENMKNKLDALQGKSLPESPDLEQVGDLMEQLAALEKATQVYLDKKNRQRKGGKGKNPYEQARMDFAAELQKFTKEKLTHLRYVQSHLSLQQLVAENVNGARTAEAVEPKGNLEPQEDKFVGRPNANEKVPDPNQKKLPEKFVFEGEFTLTVDEYTKTYEARYKEVAEQLTSANTADNWDKKKEVAAKLQSDQEIKLDQLGKKYMAGAVVKELLAMEQKLNGENGPMQQLAADRKTAELVAMVWNSESFIDKVRTLDFSVPGEMAQQKGANTPKQVAKEIMQDYLSHQRNAQQKNNQQIAPDNNAINVINVNNGGKNKNPLGF